MVLLVGLFLDGRQVFERRDMWIASNYSEINKDMRLRDHFSSDFIIKDV